jgi:hypothetical protein
MVLGLSLPSFTLLHVVISLIAVGAGLTVLVAMARGDRLPGWTALFLAMTFLTSATGFLFPPKPIGPPHIFGFVTFAVMIPTVLGLYVFRLRGWWRPIYIVGAAFILYLNCVVTVVQFFQKFSFLRPLAPTQSEPPFLIAQGVLLATIVVLGVLAGIRYRPGLSPAGHPLDVSAARPGIA